MYSPFDFPSKIEDQEYSTWSTTKIKTSVTYILAQVAQAYYENPQQHPLTWLLNYSYGNKYKTLYENYLISP